MAGTIPVSVARAAQVAWDARGGLLDFNTRLHFQPLILLNPTTGAVVSGGGWG